MPNTLLGVAENHRLNSMTRLVPKPGVKPQELLTMLVERGITLKKFEVAVPSLDEIFIKVVQEGQTSHE